MLVLTRDQVRRVDRLAAERHKIPGLILMENAGRNAAAMIDAAYGPSARAFILCGTGNNGGDGCVIARHLHNRGWAVRLVATGDESKMSADMLTNFRIVRSMKLDVSAFGNSAALFQAVASIQPTHVVIDALLGTGFQGVLRPEMARLIDAVNAAPQRATVAIDVPSGMDCDTGAAGGAAIRADLTITFVAGKPGFSTAHGKSHVGRVEVADIGAPRELIEEIAAGA